MMSVNVIYECDGCFKKSDLVILSRNFNSFSGRGHGFGVYKYDQAQDNAPDGWMAYDPYTGCCYCPDCAKELSNDDALNDDCDREMIGDDADYIGNIGNK